MISVLTSSVVGRGFESQLGQTKDYKLAFIASLPSTTRSI